MRVLLLAAVALVAVSLTARQATAGPTIIIVQPPPDPNAIGMNAPPLMGWRAEMYRMRDQINAMADEQQKLGSQMAFQNQQQDLALMQQVLVLQLQSQGLSQQALRPIYQQLADQQTAQRLQQMAQYTANLQRLQQHSPTSYRCNNGWPRPSRRHQCRGDQRLRLLRAQPGQQLFDGRRFDWLDQVAVETRLL